MTRTRRTLATLAVLPLGAALLAGCGGSDGPSVAGSATQSASTAAPSTSASSESSASASPSSESSSSSSSTDAGQDPSAILSSAKTSANAAKSAHVVGDVVDEGSKMHIDIKGQTDDKNQVITIKTATDGTATVLTVNGKSYVKADKTYWTKQGAPAAAAASIADKYVAVPAGKDSSFKQFSLKTLLAGVTKDFDTTGASADDTTVTSTTFSGQPALKLAPKSGTSTKDASITTTSDAKHYPLQVISSSGTVTFSEWNTVGPIAAPPASQIAKMPKA